MAYTCDMFPGMYKVERSCTGKMVFETLFDPRTGNEKTVMVDDYEYDPSFILANSEAARQVSPLGVVPAVRDYYAALVASRNVGRRPVVGCAFEVQKGRKYPKGSKGYVTKVYMAEDRYGRPVGLYIHGRGDDGTFYKVAAANCSFCLTAEQAAKVEELCAAAIEAVNAVEAA